MRSSCRYCGRSITWVARTPWDNKGDPHKCAPPKIKQFTREEIEKLNQERGYKPREREGND